jgi:hypothetical protein
MWDVENSIINIQPINASNLDCLVGITPPPNQSAKTYAEHHYPFFELNEEPSRVVDNFPVKSVRDLPTEKNVLQAPGRQKDLEFRTIALNSIDGKTFVPVNEMEQMIKPLNIATDICSNWDDVG